MNITVNEVTSRGSRLRRFTVSKGGEIVGLLEKFPDDRSTTNPWKAFRGWGIPARYIGAFYVQDGGRQGAIDAILGRSTPPVNALRTIYLGRPVTL